MLFIHQVRGMRKIDFQFLIVSKFHPATKEDGGNGCKTY